MPLIKEALRGTKNNLKKYLSLFLFLFLTVAVFSAMLTTTTQASSSISELQKNSILYDYEINSSLLTMKYYDVSQSDLLSVSNDDTDQNNIKNFYGNILKWFNPYQIDTDEYKKFSFLFLNNDLSKSSIIFNESNNKWELKSPLSNINLNNNSWENSWITLIGNYSSDNTIDNKTISIDGLKNYVLYEVLQNINSPIYNNSNDGSFYLNFNSNKPNISYVHTFYYIQHNNTKINYYAFESINDNNIFNLNSNAIPENFDKPDIGFFSRSDTNRVVSLGEKNNINLELNNDEIMINQQFAHINNLKIGSDIKFGNIDKNNIYSKTIKDFASSNSDLYPLTQDIKSINSDFNTEGLKSGSYVFINRNEYDNLSKALINQYSKITSDTTVYLKIPNLNNNELNNFIDGNNGLFSDYFVNKASVFYSYASSPSGEISLNTKILLIIELTIFIIVIFVIFIIIIFFIKKYIETYHNKIGILKALGYSNKKIAIIFSCSLSIVLFCSFVFGFFGSIPFQMILSNWTIYTIGANLRLFYNNIQVELFCFIYLPLFFSFLIYISSIFIVNKNLLLLIYNINLKQNKMKKNHRKIIKNKLNKMPFIFKLSFAFATRSLSKWLLVFFISTFAIFLLLFQFNVNVFIKNYQSSEYDFLNPNVKIMSSANEDQMNSLILNKDNNNQQYKTFNWISSDEAKQNLMQYKLAQYNETLNINDPYNAAVDLFWGIQNSAQALELDNVFGNAKGLFFLQKDQYISSVDSQKLINITMTDPKNPNGEKVPLWSWILKNWDEIINYLKTNPPKDFFPDETTTDYYLNKFKYFISTLENYSSISNNIYPNIYLGNYMTYDSNYEEPIIIKDSEWDPDIYKGKIYQFVKDTQFLGMDSSTVPKFNSFFNLNFQKDSLNNVLTNLNESINNNLDEVNSIADFKNIKLPVIVSKSISETNNFKVGDDIHFRINILNGYEPIDCKIVGISINDSSSEFIYSSYNNLNNFIKKYIYLINNKTIPEDKIPNYYNTLLSKTINTNKIILKIFRNLNIYANNNSDYNYTGQYIGTDILGPFASGFEHIYNSSIEQMSNNNSIQSIYVMKNLFSLPFNGLIHQMTLAEITTIIINIFILFSLISIIFDDNRRIILTLKTMGYSTWKVCMSILGFYFLIMIIGFPISEILVFIIWKILLHFIFLESGICMILTFSWLFFSLTAIIIFVIIMFNFLRGIVHINKEKINVITDL